MTSAESLKGSHDRCPVCGADNRPSAETACQSLCPKCGKLLDWFREHFSADLGVPPEAITADALLVNDLGADSLDTLEMVLQLENEFNLQISEEAAQRFESVGDAIRYVEQLVGDVPGTDR